MSTFDDFLLINIRETTVSHFNETPTFMAAIAIVGTVVASLISILWYARKPAINNSGTHPLRVPPAEDDVESLEAACQRDRSGKNLIPLLLPDQWVPPSQKIQETPLSLTGSLTVARPCVTARQTGH